MVLRGHDVSLEAFTFLLIGKLVGVVSAPRLTKETSVQLDRLTDFLMLQAAHRHDRASAIDKTSAVSCRLHMWIGLW